VPSHEGWISTQRLVVLRQPFEEVVVLDADADMITKAEPRAGDAGFRERSLGTPPCRGTSGGHERFRVATLAQSFHWLDRERVPAAIHALLSQRAG
jgi:hypothetical protein